MQNRLLVLVRESERAKFRDFLASEKLEQLQYNVPDSDTEIIELIDDCNMILAVPGLARKFLNQAKKLEWLQSTFAGVDALVEAGQRQDYILTNVKDAYGPIMAEYVFAYILALHKEIFENQVWQLEHKWNQKPYTTLHGKKIGILGTGSIGQEIARYCKAFGLETFGYNTTGVTVANFDYVYCKENLAQMLKQVDYLVSVLPNTPATWHLINQEFIDKLKESCVLISIGRGSTVNEYDLLNALKAKKIKAAVLDVFEQEPLDPNHEFWDLENVYITPHVSGFHVSDKIFEIFADNYRRFLKSEPLKYQINFEKAY